MHKAVLISDSFKGTLSTLEIDTLFQMAFHEVFPEGELLSFPVSDGGEGFIDSISRILEGKMVLVDTYDANQSRIKANYFIDKDDQAYIECASCISLPKTKQKNPSVTTSYGVGVLILDAIKRGIRHICLSLGGTSTNDCGTGILSSLGVKFYDGEGREFLPTGSTLGNIKKIDTEQMKKEKEGVSFTLLSDVRNPLLGENGCTYVFAKQKGAKEEDLPELEKQMKEFHDFILQNGYPDRSLIDGAGAAGGIACGMLTFMPCEIRSGIETYLDMIHFEEKLKDVDMIFTGEGHIDAQTKSGKVIDGICKVAKKHKIPVVALVGGASYDSEALIDEGLCSIMPINREPIDSDEIKEKAKEHYYLTSLNVLRLIRASEKIQK